MTDPGAASGLAETAAPPSSARWGAVQAKALETGLQAALLLVLPRLLGPVDFGRLTLGLTVVGLGSTAISLGAPSAFLRFVPAEPVGRRAGLARSLTLRLLPLRSAQLAIAALLGVLALALVPGRVAPLDAVLVYLALVVEVLVLLGGQVTLAMGRTRRWSFRLAARNGALLLLVPLLVLAGGSRVLLVTLVVASLAAFVCAGWPALGIVAGAERGVSVPAGALRYGAVAGLALLLGQLTYQGPVLATGVLARNGAETGFAALAGSVAVAMMFAVREVFTVSLPELVQVWAREPEAAERALHRVGWRAIAVCSAAALVGVPLLGPALHVVAGPAFAGAKGALLGVLALLPLLPLAVIGWLGAALRLRPGLGLIISGAGAVAFLAAAVVLIPGMGAAGAGAALGVAAAVSAIAGVVVLPRSVTPALLLAGMGGALLVVAIAAAVG